MTIQTEECTWRRTRAGAWVVFGPADVVRAGATVTVKTKAGAIKSEAIKSVGRPFNIGGKKMVYGYPVPRSSWDSGHKDNGCWQASDFDEDDYYDDYHDFDEDDLCPTNGDCLSFWPYRPCRYCG